MNNMEKFHACILAHNMKIIGKMVESMEKRGHCGTLNKRWCTFNQCPSNCELRSTNNQTESEKKAKKQTRENS